jgi:hypothetical protein
MPKSKTIIQRFIKDGSMTLGETPEDALDRCWELSLAFSWFARGCGAECVILRLEHPLKPIIGGKYKKFNPNTITHWVAYFPKEELVVDWTARQFWPEVPHPWVFELWELPVIWGVIEGMPEVQITLWARSALNEGHTA